MVLVQMNKLISSAWICGILALCVAGADGAICLCSLRSCTFLHPRAEIFQNVSSFCPHHTQQAVDVAILRAFMTVIPTNILDSFPNCESLEIFHGDIERLEGSLFEGNNKLKRFIVRNNNITSLENGVFAGAKYLKSLTLSSNNIANISENTFKNMILEELYLSHNKISEILPGTFLTLKNLAILSLNNNNISSLDKNTFQGLDNLKLIDLSLNKLKVLDFNGLMATHLIIKNNSIEYLVFNENLSDVAAGYNKITNINSDEAKSLTRVHLDGNKLTDVRNITKLTKVSFLSLSGNLLNDDTSFGNMTELEDLHLSMTYLKLHPKLFENLHMLKTLDLGYNNLTEIDFNIFVSLKLLKVLSLNGNQLKVIKYAEAKHVMPRLTVLEVCRNGWNSTYFRHNMDELKRHGLDADSYGIHELSASLFEVYCTSDLDESRSVDYIDDNYEERSFDSYDELSKIVEQKAITDPTELNDTSENQTSETPNITSSTTPLISEHAEVLQHETLASRIDVFHIIIYCFSVVGLMSVVFSMVYIWKKQRANSSLTILDTIRLL